MQNQRLSERSDEDWARVNDSPSFNRALKKARTVGLYLGLDDDWVDY